MQPQANNAAGLAAAAEGAAETSHGNFSDSAGKEVIYGAIQDWKQNYRQEQARALASHKRMNCVPVLISLMLPWFAFLGAFALASLYIHYAAPFSTLCIYVLALFACLQLGFAAKAERRRGGDWFYLAYLWVACSIGVVVGGCLGDFNFWAFMRPTYALHHMASYTNVDPSSQTLWTGQVVPTTGRRFQDAGAVYFNSKAILDKKRAYSFKMGTLYCVAPIINPSCERNCGYDFWAIGTDCCSEDSSDFQCGEYNNTHAKTGLRLMDDGLRQYYRLAVLEAEGAHNIASKHPIFLYWMQDPLSQVHTMIHQGYRRLIVAQFVSFFANAGALAFSMKFFHVGGL
jgi:hypothetical protein